MTPDFGHFPELILVSRSVTCGFVVGECRSCALAAAVEWPGVPYVRTVKTASGATAVQIVYSSHRGSRDIEHLGLGA